MEETLRTSPTHSNIRVQIQVGVPIYQEQKENQNTTIWSS